MATATIKKPDDIECVLQFSMTLRNWKYVRETLNQNPAWAEIQVISEINNLVYKLEQTLVADAGNLTEGT
jgi:hypothetical protein